MTQYNPRPGMEDVQDWGVLRGQLTGTSAGGRWTTSGGGNGYIALQLDAFNRGPAIVKGKRYAVWGVQIRRNSASSGPLSSMALGTYATADGGSSYSDLSVEMDLRDIWFPVGEWITIPVMKNPYFAAGYNNNEGRVVLWFFDGTAATDYTIKRVRIYSWDEIPNENAGALDAGDNGFTLDVDVDNLTVDATFKPSSLNEAIRWIWWDWGDGETDAGWAGDPDPTSTHTPWHEYATAGTYTVTCGIENRAAGTNEFSTHTTSRTIQVPAGEFQAAFTYQDQYLDIETDASGSVYESWVDEYLWDWGDGTTSTGLYASHTYAQSGLYVVTLTMSNSLGQESIATAQVTIESIPVSELYITADRSLLEVTFSPSTDAGTGYAWSFGDGATSTETSPTHTYATAGTYTVSLTVTTETGTMDAQRTILVKESYTRLRSADMASLGRLEVRVPTQAGLENLCLNPSGELGGYGWETPGAGTVRGSDTINGPNDHGIEGWKLILETDGSSQTAMATEPARCDPGDWVAASWRMPYCVGYVRAQVYFFDEAGQSVGFSDPTGYLAASGGTLRTEPFQAPAGTFSTRLYLGLYHDVDMDAQAGDHALIRYVMLAKAATAAELENLSYNEAATWLNVIGPTHEIAVNRPALDVGTLSATILDARLDPARADRLRPGQAVRLRVKTEAADGSALWETLFNGSTKTLDVTYDYAHAQNRKHARISLTATDVLDRAAATAEPSGIGAIPDLPLILEGKGVPYVVNGSSDQVPDGVVVSQNENASLVDQVAITRDSALGYAWVSRTGVLNVWDRDLISQAVAVTLSEDDYSDLDIQFSTDTCINDVRITWLRPTSDGAEEIPYGPYVDQASIDQWGRHIGNFTMHGATEVPSTIAGTASEILSYNSIPEVRVRSVTVPIRYAEDIGTTGLVDLYDLVTTTYAPLTEAETNRVTSVEHSITAAGWMVKIGYEADGAVASPQVTPAPPVATGGGNTAWQALPSQVSGVDVKYRVKSGFVCLSAEGSGTVIHAGNGNQALVDAGHLPTEYCPSAQMWAAAHTAGVGGWIRCMPSGGIQLRQESGSNQTGNIYASMNFPMEDA